jgi:glycosyltransferase involved in cell wall biosynthesis
MIDGTTRDQIRPKVSVCIATYNGSKFIAQQLKSVLPQLMPGDEIIVSDDSSQDDTVRIIEGFSDSRIRVYKDQIFHSSTYNFEHCLSHATGDAIFLCDQDDEWMDGWVNTALAELQEASLIVCDSSIINAGSESLPREWIYGGIRRPGVLRNLYRNGYIGCCCAFRRKVLDAALPFPKSLQWHDWWIGLVADALFSTKFIPQKMIRYRRHGGNASPTGERSPFSLRKKLAMRWHIGTALALRWSKMRLRNLL